MNIVIVGQGAIGLLWYSQLARQMDNNVSLLCSKNIKQPPSAMLLIDKQQRQIEIPLQHTNDTLLAQAEIVLFCLKAFDQINTIHELSAKLSPNTALIMAHNGMVDIDKIDQVHRINHPLLTLLTTHGCKKVQTFHIKHTGLGHSDLGFTEYDKSESRNWTFSIKQQTAIIERLNSALPSVSWHGNIKEKQWLKLAINSVINPITALENIENGQVLSAKFDVRIDQILAEVVTIATQENISFTHTQLKALVLEVAKSTAKNSSSMRCDFLNKKASEIDHITGYIVGLGKKHQISTPVNTLLWQQIKMKEKTYLR